MKENFTIVFLAFILLHDKLFPTFQPYFKKPSKHSDYTVHFW